MLCYQRSYILEHTRSQTSLNQQRVVIVLAGLDHTQVVDTTVVIQIQVIDHVATRVKQLLKLTHRTTLCKSRSYGIEVQIETRIGVVVGHGEGRYGRHLR